MKKAVAVLLCITLMTAMFAVTASALTLEEALAGYYLVGTMTDWQIDGTYRLYQDLSDENKYEIRNVSLTSSDAFKVVYSHNGSAIDTYYPAGGGNDCTLANQGIESDGIVDITFLANMNGSVDWYFGCIRIELRTVMPTDPTEDKTSETDGGYYVVFKGDNNTIRQRNRMEREFGQYAVHNLTMSLSTPFKIAYSSDLETVTALYPQGADDYYTPRYNSRYFTVEFTPDGRNGGSSSDRGWYDGYVRAYPCEPPVEDSDEAVPVTEKEIKRNLFEDAFIKSYPFCIDDSYDELYYHIGAFGRFDWVLVKVERVDPVEGDSYGIFDDVLLFNAEHYPFDYGYGVYDLAEDKFYSITKAWSMGYEDLQDVFINIIRNHEYTRQLGDVDGDGELSIIDATLIQRSLVGMVDPDDFSWWCRHYSCSFGTRLTSIGDYDDDGECEITDVTLIQRALADMKRYPHAFTATAELRKDGDTVMAAANTAFGEEPSEYRFSIECGVYASSVYLSDFGRFHVDDNDPEPGDFQITTGWIADDQVELPLTSLTYNDTMTLKVEVRDARGNEVRPVELYFINVY